MRRTTRGLLAGTAIAAAGLLFAQPAGACGGLVGENGSIQLVRTATLAAWHDGVEHYVTSFEFTGSGKSVGSIIPLPGVPTDVTAAGEWTLQRLQREIAPPPETGKFATVGSAISGDAEVLLETKVDALDITVLRGGGDEVGRWALEHGFFLTPDAPEVLDFYAERSQVFLAAKFVAERAAAQGLGGGDATPIHISIPLAQPWVPLRILGLGLPPEREVEADVFLLTDDKPSLLADGDGLRLSRSEHASPSLMADLRSDRGMDWMPEDMWFTHLALADTAGDLHYDLSAGTANTPPSRIAAGLGPNGHGTVVTLADHHRLLDVTLVLAVTAALVLTVRIRRNRRTAP
jgi:hypothetical protein